MKIKDKPFYQIVSKAKEEIEEKKQETLDFYITTKLNLNQGEIK